MNSRGSKGREGRRLWGIYRRLGVGRRLGFQEIGRWGRTPCGEGREGLEVGDDRWGPPIGERRGGRHTLSG
jgi:hypothetical protein